MGFMLIFTLVFKVFKMFKSVHPIKNEHLLNTN